ncbi:hypothetical protein [Clostridium taeniosporum]|uniref:DUF4325 domain-containing protein n=1 Tax=Clostridium taeniosporum TaxID=394958 RepID=A0A1D7XNB0_9CLOT|nr:hypothetical protein [Clostridium taeniosporum]AOR24609.1 hypothetical protein BGI42_13045 [Clostridium taeniosporum]
MKIEKINVLCKYSINIEKNKFIIKGDGLFSKEDAEDYIKIFQNAIKTTDVKDLILIIDNGQFRMSFPDTKSFYENVCNAYINAEFKEKYIIMPENDIAKIQIRKNADRIFDYIKVISDINVIE